MKIVFLARLYWPHGGGVEKHVEKLSEQFLKHGDKVTVITEQYDQDLPEREIHNGVEIYRIPYFAIQTKLSLWTWMEKNIQLFDMADVVHVHDVFWWYWPIWFLRLVKPVYITFHGYEGNEPPTKRAVFWRKTAEIICRGSICVGEFMKKWYLASPSKITYGAADIQPLPVRKDKTAVFLGRFEEDTGVLVYAEAFKRMKQFKKVYFYGSGSQEKDLIKWRGDNDRYEIHGWTNNVMAAMKRGRYALVSRYLGILEAMQSEKIVIAVYNNRIKQDYLLCHPMRDNMIIAGGADELEYKLNQLLKSPEKEYLMKQRAKSWADKQTWTKMMKDYLDLWEK